LIVQVKHQNVSFFAFAATPKDQMLDLLGTKYEHGIFRSFHVYSMKKLHGSGISK
jgi:type I restriction enzyme R subunit